MTTSPSPPTRTADETVRRFLEALERHDFAALEDCLAPDVWFRALLPRSLHESGTAGEAAGAYRSWYGRASRAERLDAEHHVLANRVYLRYRFRLLPPWAPAEWHVVEQAGFCRVRGGRISRLDVVCTGFHPWSEGAAGRPRSAAELGEREGGSFSDTALRATA